MSVAAHATCLLQLLYSRHSLAPAHFDFRITKVFQFFDLLFVFVTEIRLKDAGNRKRRAEAAAAVAAALGGCVYR